MRGSLVKNAQIHRATAYPCILPQVQFSGDSIRVHINTYTYVSTIRAPTRRVDIWKCRGCAIRQQRMTLKWQRGLVWCQTARRLPQSDLQRLLSWLKLGTVSQGPPWPPTAHCGHCIGPGAWFWSSSCWFSLSFSAGRWYTSVWGLGANPSGFLPATTSPETWRQRPMTPASPPTAPYVSVSHLGNVLVSQSKWFDLFFFIFLSC